MNDLAAELERAWGAVPDEPLDADKIWLATSTGWVRVPEVIDGPVTTDGAEHQIGKLQADVRLLAAKFAPRAAAQDARAVTKARACRLLGIDKKTLADLIAEKVIRTVKWRGRIGGRRKVGGELRDVDGERVRIPVSEIDRLAEEGIPAAGARRTKRDRATRTKPLRGNVGDAIRAIKL